MRLVGGRELGNLVSGLGSAFDCETRPSFSGLKVWSTIKMESNSDYVHEFSESMKCSSD